jgi:hypothetical protein
VPHSLSGYGFLFSTARDLGLARRLLADARPDLTLACDDGDPVLRPIADRFALNAREAGAIVRVGNRLPADILLRRIPGRLTDP